MGQKNTPNKILELFYESPTKRFTVREIAKQTNIPKSTVQNYLNELKKKNLITRDNEASNTDLFRIKKINHFIEKIYASRLIEELKKTLIPSCIILFGSFRKGDSEKDSDIDLFIETTKKEIPDLSKYERKLRHKLQLFLETNINNIPERLLSNVINGIKLEGYFKVKNEHNELGEVQRKVHKKSSNR